MCFDQKSSFGFAAIGLAMSYYVFRNTNNTRLAVGVFWFFLMEFLQGFQYFFINDCDNTWNQILTLLGYIHICYQPFFTHIINSSLTRNPKIKDQYEVVLKLCLLGGTMLLGRYFVSSFTHTAMVSDFADWSGAAPVADASCRTQEWLRGEKLCTYKGNYHLAWSVPMYDPTYWSPSAAIHSFLMFGPFFVMKRNMILQGIVLWGTGPYLASWITPNLQEQASIWCFFSITQIGFMLYVIREQLILGGGKTSASMHEKHQQGQAPQKQHTNGSKKSIKTH